MTVLATNSFSSTCMEANALRRGETKYRQMIGSSVIAGIFLVGMISDLTISNRSFRKTSQFYRVARSLKNR